jgi:DNA modification methylase
MSDQLVIHQVEIRALKPATYNPRKWDVMAIKGLTDSIKVFGLVDPIIANNAPGRENIVIGGHFRLKVAKDLGYTEIPVVYLNIPDENRERKLNLHLNRSTGSWDYELLAEFDQSLLEDVGFTSEEMDDIFSTNVIGEDTFDLDNELKKLHIESIEVKTGDIYRLGTSRLMVGDSTIVKDVSRLMADEKADMAICDEPYITASNYKGGNRHGKPTVDKGPKRSRRYLETEEMPDNFTALWLENIANIVAKPDFSLIAFEAWYNLRVLWDEVEKHMIVKNMLIWNIPRRNQAFAADYKFFNKYDIAVIGGQGNVEINDAIEPDGLQETYETALYAIQGKPHWEKYEGPKKQRPTDFAQLDTDDKKNSGQDIIFGTKPLSLLQPYIKVLTKRGDLIVDLFCGSGSTLIAATQLSRRCYTMEKSVVYAEIALRRWEIETGLKREKLS